MQVTAALMLFQSFTLPKSMDFSTGSLKYNLWRYIIISLFIIQGILAVFLVLYYLFVKIFKNKTFHNPCSNSEERSE